MHVDPSDLASLRLYTRQHLYTALRLTPVLVNRANGTETRFSATGFILMGQSPDRQSVPYLVSNRHVLDPSYDAKYREYFLEAIEVDGTVTSDRVADVTFRIRLDSPVAIVPSDYDLDIAFVRLAPEQLRAADWPHSFSSVDIVHAAEILRDEVGVGSQIVMAGYPAVGGSAGHRPLLVPGLVSSDLRFDPEYGANVYAKRGLCHAFSRGGMSGSPVLTTIVEHDAWLGSDTPEKVSRRVKLLGVNCGHVTEATGSTALTLFVSAHVLDEMLADQGDRSAAMRVRIGRMAEKATEDSSHAESPLIDENQEAT